MKGLIAALLIAAAVCAGSMVHVRHISGIAEELEAMNDSVMQLLGNDDYAGAEQEIAAMHDYIESKRTVLSATGSHAMLDNIEINIFELSGYTEGEKKADAISKCRALHFLFEHMPADYKLKIGNIL